MNTDVDLRVASLARQMFRIPLPLALKLPFGVWGQGGTVIEKYQVSNQEQIF
jgi:hypothetical protein